jgi:hypothetical protein
MIGRDSTVTFGLMFWKNKYELNDGGINHDTYSVLVALSPSAVVVIQALVLESRGGQGNVGDNGHLGLVVIVDGIERRILGRLDEGETTTHCKQPTGGVFDNSESTFRCIYVCRLTLNDYDQVLYESMRKRCIAVSEPISGLCFISRRNGVFQLLCREDPIKHCNSRPLQK